MTCSECNQPLPLRTFPGAYPERQHVFTWRDGQRVHVPPCPASDDEVDPTHSAPIGADED